MESNRARLAVLLTAVVAIVVLFVVLSSGDDESSPATTSASVPTATADGDGGGNGRAKHANHPNRQKGNGKPDEPSLPTVVLQNGQPIGGVLKLSVTSGDEVKFAVDADAPNEVHIHGYEIYEDIKPGQNVISFTADLEGAYEIETHVEPETQIAELEVNPG